MKSLSQLKKLGSLLVGLSLLGACGGVEAEVQAPEEVKQLQGNLSTCHNYLVYDGACRERIELNATYTTCDYGEKSGFNSAGHETCPTGGESTTFWLWCCE